jgi:phosphoglycolate phosphatase
LTGFGRIAALNRPRAVVFDWDNTLIDSWAAIQDAQNHVFAHFGMPLWTLEETRRRVRGSMRDSYPAMFGDRWREAGEVFYARFVSRHKETIRELPGARDLLADLAGAGIYLAVVSNKKGDYLREEAEHLGFERFFKRIVGAFDAPRDKPAVEPVDLALVGSGIARGRQVWFVGDADIDMECATNAGCIPILVRDEPPGEEEFGAHPPARHVENCMALSNLVRNL